MTLRTGMRFGVRAVYSAASMAVLVATMAFAGKETGTAELSLDELMNLKVESVGFFVLDKDKAPGTIWTITTDELKGTPLTYLKDLFDWYVPGSNIGFQMQTGPVIGTRGINLDQSSKTLFMVDGQGLNQKSHFGYSTGLASPLFGDIAKIEVINGPGSLTHGSGAINGFVNLVPKNGKDFEGTEVSMKYGPVEKLQTWEAGTGIDWKNDCDLYVYGGIGNALGFHPRFGAEIDQLPEQYIDNKKWTVNDLVCDRLDEAYRFAAYLRAKGFSLNAQMQRIVKSQNSAVDIEKGEKFEIDNKYSWQTFAAVQAKYQLDLGSSNTLTFTAPIEFFDHGVRDNDEQGDKAGREMHVAGEALYRQEFLDGKNKFAIGGGAGMRSFDPKKQWFETDKKQIQESMLGSWVEYQAYCEDIWNIIDPLTVSLGGRFDGVSYGTFMDTAIAPTPTDPGWVVKHDDLASQSSFSPRIAVAYEVVPKTVVKASYQEGFRWPDAAYFLYIGRINDSLGIHDSNPLPSLKPEKLRSFELNVTSQPVKDFGLSINGNAYYNVTTGSLAWGDYTKNNLDTARLKIAGNALGWGGYAGSFMNSPDDLKSIGFEIGARFNQFKWLDAQVNYGLCVPIDMKASSKDYTYLSDPNDSNSVLWKQFPEHMVKASGTIHFSPKLSLNLSGVYESAVNYTPDPTSYDDIRESMYSKDNARERINAALSYMVTDKIRATVGVANITEDRGPSPSYTSATVYAKNGGMGDYARTEYFSIDAKF
jgi:outer membrane receptor protein involved in Fe transport